MDSTLYYYGFTTSFSGFNCSVNFLKIHMEKVYIHTLHTRGKKKSVKHNKKQRIISVLDYRQSSKK